MSQPKEKNAHGFF